MPQREQLLIAGALSFQLPARRLRVLAFDFFFFGTVMSGYLNVSIQCAHRPVGTNIGG